MLSFQTAIWKKWNEQNVVRLPLNNSSICFFCSGGPKTHDHLKRGMQLIIWQTMIMFRIVRCGTTCSSGRSYADWYCASIEPFRSFLVSHYSRRDSEMWRIHSQKTKNSVPPKPWERPRRAGCLTVAEWLTGRNRTKTGQCRMMTGEAAFLGFSLSDILVDHTGISAMPIYPISQCTFVWLNIF